MLAGLNRTMVRKIERKLKGPSLVGSDLEKERRMPAKAGTAVGTAAKEPGSSIPRAARFPALGRPGPPARTKRDRGRWGSRTRLLAGEAARNLAQALLLSALAARITALATMGRTTAKNAPTTSS